MSALKYIAKDETVYLYSMGKRLKITAIFTDDDTANAHMEQSDDALVAVFGPFLLCANKYDNGLNTPKVLP